MSPSDDSELHVDDEPEAERPFGTGEEQEPESSGLALDPYADDLLIAPKRSSKSPWLLIVVVIVLIVIALALALVVLRTHVG